MSKVLSKINLDGSITNALEGPDNLPFALPNSGNAGPGSIGVPTISGPGIVPELSKIDGPGVLPWGPLTSFSYDHYEFDSYDVNQWQSGPYSGNWWQSTHYEFDAYRYQTPWNTTTVSDWERQESSGSNTDGPGYHSWSYHGQVDQGYSVMTTTGFSYYPYADTGTGGDPIASGQQTQQLDGPSYLPPQKEEQTSVMDFYQSDSFDFGGWKSESGSGDWWSTSHFDSMSVHSSSPYGTSDLAVWHSSELDVSNSQGPDYSSYSYQSQVAEGEHSSWTTGGYPIIVIDANPVGVSAPDQHALLV